MRTGSRRRPLVAIAGAAALAWLWLVARRSLDVVEVRGRSMVPTLLPGDRLLVERLTYRRRAPQAGDVVLALDPRAPEREVIKRVYAAGPELDLRGDAPQASTDSRTFGVVPATAVRWRAAFRYWPPGRIGSLRR